MNKLDYNGYYADCYVLTNERSKSFINSFLENFLPEREESANEYEFPQYESEASICFKNLNDLIDFLVENKNYEYSIYWKNLNKNDLIGVMIFFNKDEKIIVGLSCETLFNDNKIETTYFEKLKEFCNSNLGYITYEEPPIINTNHFLERIK